MLAGLALVSFLLIAVAVAAPAWLRRDRYRPGLGWDAESVWFNGPDGDGPRGAEPGDAGPPGVGPRGAAADEAGAPRPAPPPARTPEGPSPGAATGGARATW